MIEAVKMFLTSKRVPYEDWVECSIAEAADQFLVFMPDVDGRQEHAMEVARLFIAKDKEVCEAWGLLYRIAETEPLPTPATAPPMAEEDKPRIMRQEATGWKLFAGGKK